MEVYRLQWQAIEVETSFIPTHRIRNCDGPFSCLICLKLRVQIARMPEIEINFPVI